MRDIDELLRASGNEWRVSQPPSAVELDPADFPASVRSRLELNRIAVGTAGVVGAVGLALLLAVVWLQRPVPPIVGQASTPPTAAASATPMGSPAPSPTPQISASPVAATPTPTIATTPTPTASGGPLYSALLRMSFADGSPATKAGAYAISLDQQDSYVGTKDSPGVRLLDFGTPGSYCIWVNPGGDLGGYPTYTLSASGTLMANSDFHNPDCNLNIPAGELVIDISFPPFISVPGVVRHSDGTACEGSVKATTGQGTFKASAVTRSNGHFTIYLVPGEWTFSAIGLDEFGPDVPSTTVDVGKGGATDIDVLCGPAPAAMSTLVVG